MPETKLIADQFIDIVKKVNIAMKHGARKVFREGN
jgi:hypothetical protein